MPMLLKKRAAKISRTGSNRIIVFFASSFGAVLISMPERNAPTSPEWRIFSVIIVIVMHRLTTPNSKISCDFELWSIPKTTGNEYLHIITTAVMSTHFAKKVTKISRTEPEDAITGNILNRTAKVKSCITSIPTVILPPELLISFDSTKPLTTIVVDDMASTQPRKMASFDFD
eukprot:CAMPEP_0197544672 /NCGR_PEP_ID=MMETSP1318-20131121/68894_1 /TAXON_ID=552666 /ORGANISM="Partenskyella glossopodia, Strain RCC365" /LENGTH=172 /DNA_ID=CAMNT_0043104085 /DNA_START=444 /DNA_END=962 /DNA_ORIENTATION=-